MYCPDVDKPSEAMNTISCVMFAGYVCCIVTVVSTFSAPSQLKAFEALFSMSFWSKLDLQDLKTREVYFKARKSTISHEVLIMYRKISTLNLRTYGVVRTVFIMIHRTNGIYPIQMSLLYILCGVCAKTYIFALLTHL